jgi:hypothetical protein
MALLHSAASATASSNATRSSQVAAVPELHSYPAADIVNTFPDGSSSHNAGFKTTSLSPFAAQARVCTPVGIVR